MSDEKDLALKAKLRKPEYQRLDLEPKIGGNSLINKEFGTPYPNKEKIPPIKEISNEPFLVKASVPNNAISFKKPKIQVTAAKLDTDNEDDKFIPPKSNFVSVGHVEHAWYDDKVSGIIDNNEKVDVDSLQGLNPLTDTTNAKVAKSLEFFTKRLAYIKNFTITELAEVSSIQDLLDLKVKIFGKKGIFTELLKQLGGAEGKEKIGELINHTYSEIQLELEGKNFELESEADEDDEGLEWPEDMAVITKPEIDDEENTSDETDEDEDSADSEGTPSEPTIPEGYYAIIVDGKLLEVVESLDKARDIISQLVLTDNVVLDSIQLVKRLKIDFGIILG